MLAKYAPAPLAPASTVHAAHVAAALGPAAAYTYTAAAAAPLAYAAAPAAYAYASPYAYDAGYTVSTHMLSVKHHPSISNVFHFCSTQYTF